MLTIKSFLIWFIVSLSLTTSTMIICGKFLHYLIDMDTENMRKNNWHLYFCETQKAFYRTNSSSIEKLISDQWIKVNIDKIDLKFLNWTDLGRF